MFTDYKSVSGSMYFNFVEAVKQEMANGWQPLGGISTTTVKFDKDGKISDEGKVGFIYDQAMVK